eukprot:9469179-Pyramimonas_sp.AAC.2
MIYQCVFGETAPPPDAQLGGVVIPPHEDECLRALLQGLLRSEPEQRMQILDCTYELEQRVQMHSRLVVTGGCYLCVTRVSQSADEALTHPFFVAGKLGWTGTSEPIVQTEWKLALVREYGRRLQADRQPIQVDVDVNQMTDAALYAFAQLCKGTLVHPLEVSFMNVPAGQTAPPSLYAAFFGAMLHAPHPLFETHRGYNLLPPY